MRAIDTNILVRLIARDDEAQVAAAERVVDASFMLLPTVVLETEWVLRARYGLSRDRVADGIERVAGLPGATVVAASALVWALHRWRVAGDFADLLHVALAADAGAEVFATFDRRVARDAGDDAPITIEIVE